MFYTLAMAGRSGEKVKQRYVQSILMVCLLMTSAACVRVSQTVITPFPTGGSLVIALTITPSPEPSSNLQRMPATFAPSPEPSSTPYPTRPATFPTFTVTASRPSPLPASATPTFAKLASFLPTATQRPTSSPTSPPTALPGNTSSIPLIPPSAPRVYETTISIPTYDYGRALEPSGKDDPIYPYPHLNFDKVGPLAPKGYRALVLENSYIQVTFLPELGGRIWRIVDRTTGRTVTYQNPVVKPTHWGYRGWWLATGGIEWCLPVDEHGLNEYRPWNVSISGASVTVSDHEDRTGLDVAVTISLDASHSYVTLQPRITNSTGNPQKMQFWINAMLALNGNRATEATHFILSSAQVTVHSTGDDGLPGPGSKLTWPVYKGRDLSTYANWRGHLGFFASPSASGDFAGAYDASSDQGIVRVFPSGTARGVKFFGGKGIDTVTWTNDGSTYFELWGGLLPTFLDYTTIQPGQTFGWTEHWYPVSGLGQGFDTANAVAALRLTRQGDTASVSVVTSANLTALVRLWQNGQTVTTWQAAIGPGRAFNSTQAVASGAFGLQLLDSAGNVVAQTGSVP